MKHLKTVKDVIKLDVDIHERIRLKMAVLGSKTSGFEVMYESGHTIYFKPFPLFNIYD